MTTSSPRRAGSSTLFVLGALIGAYSTLCGIGGGVFAVPLLHFLYGMSMRTAVANSLVLVSASTMTATLFELMRADSALRLDVVTALVVGSTIGSLLGFALGKRVTPIALKALFALVLTGVAIHILVSEDARTAFSAAPTHFDPTWLNLGHVAAIGFVAGIVAPLFGIGGGLVSVPGLLAWTPELGFLAARACSMAMSVFTSWQSVWMYRREGVLRGGAAPWLALGAAGGAVLGVQLVHIESVTRAARGLVAFALVFAAARFAWDVVVAYRPRLRT